MLIKSRSSRFGTEVDGDHRWVGHHHQHMPRTFSLHQAIAQGYGKPDKRNGPAMSPTTAPARGVGAFGDSGAAPGTAQLLRASSNKFLPGPLIR